MEDPLNEAWRAFAEVGERPAGSEGERRAAEVARVLLGPIARTEGLVVFPHRDALHAALASLAALACLLAPVAPLLAAVSSCLALVGLLAETSGIPLVANLLPRAAAYNVVAQRRGEGARATVVFAAPLDSPRSRPADRRTARLGVVGAALALLLTGTAVVGTAPSLTVRVVCALPALAAALSWLLVARGSGRSPDPGAPAAAVQCFAGADDGTVDILLCLCAAGHARQEGLDALLGARLANLAQPVLVVCFDDVGRAPLRVAEAEGLLRAMPHRPTGPALVERLGARGSRVASVDLPFDTLGAAPRRLGARALVLVGGDGAPDVRNAAAAVRLAQDAVRMWVKDLEGA